MADREETISRQKKEKKELLAKIQNLKKNSGKKKKDVRTESRPHLENLILKVIFYFPAERRNRKATKGIAGQTHTRIGQFRLE